MKFNRGDRVGEPTCCVTALVELFITCVSSQTEKSPSTITAFDAQEGQMVLLQRLDIIAILAAFTLIGAIIIGAI